MCMAGGAKMLQILDEKEERTEENIEQQYKTR